MGLAEVLTEKVTGTHDVPRCHLQTRTMLPKDYRSARGLTILEVWVLIFAGAELQPLLLRAAPYCISRKQLTNMSLPHQRQRLQPSPGISSFL